MNIFSDINLRRPPPPPAALHSGAAREAFQRRGGVRRESGVHRRL